MSRKLRWGLLGLVAMFSFLLAAQGLAGEGWKKTMSLPSGEVVCDLKGVWEYELSLRGMTANYRSGKLFGVIEINQEGGSFKGIHLSENQYDKKGEVAIEGEVDKNGIKQMYYKSGANASYAGFFKAELNKDGSKIEINEREFTLELSRK